MLLVCSCKFKVNKITNKLLNHRFIKITADYNNNKLAAGRLLGMDARVGFMVERTGKHIYINGA